ncbi:polynucleotide kinase-phosphatase [Ideonella alba]|uniref:Polynucleotide kinase-phosphatase n=1 Tax=Ideonella alba TaxID=2824118 RepID=A0A940YE43_9BURK|nr:polynucleotide kinase-phosphatase [Ideonella alba]MBQ0933441.1 polynucleotide kinase-phosphatase [Ideonella alba]
MQIDIPELCLVMLVGATGSGKSTFARRHFLPTEVVSSDFCRAALADDENDQSVTQDAFELMHSIVSKRLRLGRLTVVDATNVRPASRQGWIELAKTHNVLCVAIVFDLPDQVLVERHAQRTDRPFGAHVIRHQRQDLSRSLRGLEREGCRYVHVLRQAEQVDQATVSRTRLWTNRRDETGPFDIVGDVHGCLDELLQLTQRLGYAHTRQDGGWQVRHPQGRKLVFVGDLVDRGPDSPGVVRFVQGVVASGAGFCVAGNHDVKLARALMGRDVQVTHGLERSLAQLADASAQDRRDIAAFLDGLVSHYVLDGGRLVVAHAGLTEELQGRSSARVRSFAMYGETTGETDEFGLPVRYPWAKAYRGQAMVVYGHTPVPQAEWLNNTICLDTGCVFGGQLTALRYPEKELVSVTAAREYYPPMKPLVAAAPPLSAQLAADDMLDIDDVGGKRYITTEVYGTVQVREENAAAALEVMSRFAADPRWLIYLPPTMSPAETSAEPALLEHPAEALAYYRKNGVAQVICEEKHMGSRAVLIVCRGPEVALRRFGVQDEGIGIVHTRTGRRFFADTAIEQALLAQVAEAAERAGLWDELSTDWLCLDGELMPWSAKAIELIRTQYAPVAASGSEMLSSLQDLLGRAAAQGRSVEALQRVVDERLSSVRQYRDAYGRYCWDVGGLADLRLAPFHLLAAEGRTFVDQPHDWHMRTLARLAAEQPALIIATPHRVVNLDDEAACTAAVEWWRSLTAQGGEGMVVKPIDFVTRGRKGLLQPAIKCRGPEYLRIIYGPEYLRPEHLERLRERNVSAKRNLALREFALGIESLSRFVRQEPLRRVHECVFGVLALESEPIDPRL